MFVSTYFLTHYIPTGVNLTFWNRMEERILNDPLFEFMGFSFKRPYQPAAKEIYFYLRQQLTSSLPYQMLKLKSLNFLQVQ